MPNLKSEFRNNWPDWNIYLHDACRCVYCGYVGTEFDKWGHLQIDHVIPTGKGGSNTEENKVVACGRCNSFKGRFDPSHGIRPYAFDADWRGRMAKVAYEERIFPKVEALRKEYDEMMHDLDRCRTV